MAARAKQREAAGIRQGDGSEYPPAAGHDGHATHVCYPNIRCSCGEVTGVVCFTYTEDTKTIPCPICGEDRLG